MVQSGADWRGVALSSAVFFSARVAVTLEYYNTAPP